MTSELIFSGGGRERALTIVRRHGARAMRLTVDPRDACVRLSLPPRAALRPAIAWAAGKRGWVESALDALPRPVPIASGTCFTLGGEVVTIDWSPRHARVVRRDLGVLFVGGPIEGLPGRVLAHAKRAALTALDAETRALAKRHQIEVGRIGVGDPKGRWGSCSARGDIRYSWRLILAPCEVLSATVAHEVGHLVHMNHGAEFHALVAKLHGGDPSASRAWLRAHGAGLHWFGRDG